MKGEVVGRSEGDGAPRLLEPMGCSIALLDDDSRGRTSYAPSSTIAVDPEKAEDKVTERVAVCVEKGYQMLWLL